ncbi:MAG: hypothetical protein IKP65_06655 [Alphaproteobacteria bacterium]|nr:hypothetical protein [Alphaproteobacteria bacterium]
MISYKKRIVEVINYEHYYKVYLKRKSLGKIKFVDSENRKYENLPKHKFFNFLKTAFEESPWVKIQKFRFKDNPNKEYHIDYIYWEYVLDGYVLKILCHHHYDEHDFSKKSHAIFIIKNINCMENPVTMINLDEIEIIE